MYTDLVDLSAYDRDESDVVDREGNLMNND